MNINSVRPLFVTANNLAGQNTLILRSPALSLPAELSSTAPTVCEWDLATLSSSLDSDFKLRTEFDQSWLRASYDEREAFVNRLSEEKSATLVTTPYALDWIWEEMEDGHQEKLVNGIDEALIVGYPQENEAAVASAIERCVELGTDSETGNTALNESNIRNNLETLTYTHSFQNEDLSTKIGTYGPTIVPDLVTTISTSSWQSGLSMTGIKQACQDIVEGFTLREFFIDTTESFREVADTVPAEIHSDIPKSIAEWTTTIGADTLPWGGVSSLLIWGVVRNKNEVSGEEFIKELGGLNLLPTARASLEAEAGMPPRTLDLISGPESDVFISKLRSVISDEKISEEALDIQDSDYTSKLEAIEDAIDRLDKEIDSFAGLYSEHLDSAVHSLDVINKQLVNDEARLLTSLIDADSLTADNIRYIDSIREDTEATTAVKEIRNTATDGGFVILNGPRGTGKTSAAFQAAKQLKQHGHPIIVPNLQEHSGEFVKKAITQTGDDRQRILYASFEIGPPRTRVSQEDLATLSNWLEQGVCHTVMLECRSEMNQTLQSQLNDLAVRSHGVETAEIEFAPFEKSEQGQELINWVIRQSNINTLDSETRNEILSIADGNPEILKLATRFAISDDESLAEITTARELILTDLQSLFDRSSHPRELYERVVVLLAVSGGLSTAQLAAALDISRTDLQAKLTDMRGYLANPVRTQLADRSLETSENDQWELSPDVYADATLQRCILGDRRYDFWWAFNTLFSESYKNVDLSFQLLNVARRLGITFATARKRGDGDLMTMVQDTSHELVNRVDKNHDSVRFQQVLTQIIEQGVPLSADLLEENCAKVVQGGIEGDTNYIVGSPAAVLHRSLGVLLAAHVNCDADPEDVIEVSRRLASWANTQFDYRQNRFLANVYRLGIPALFEMGSGESDDALEKMNSLIHRSAHTTANTGIFLSNTYAASLSTPDYYPQYQGDPPWLEYINNCIWETALDEKNDIVPAPFIANTYGSAIRKYGFLMPNEPTEWIWNTFDLIKKSISENSDLETTNCDLLQDTYRTAISKMATTEKRDISIDWPATLLKQIEETSTASWHAEDADRFRQCMAAAVMAGTALSNPQEIGGWSSNVIDLCLQNLTENDINELYQRTVQMLAADELDRKIAWIVADCFERFKPVADENQPPELCFETVAFVAATALKHGIEVQDGLPISDSDHPKMRYLNHQIGEQVGHGLLYRIPGDRLSDAISDISSMIEWDSDELPENSVAIPNKIESELVVSAYTAKITSPKSTHEREKIINEALEVAEATTANRLTTWLLLKQGIVGVGIAWDISSPPEYYQTLIENAQSHSSIPYEEFAVDTIKQVCRESGADSRCAIYVARDALKHWEIEKQCWHDRFDEIADMIAVAVDDGYYMSKRFKTVIDPIITALQSIEEKNSEIVAELVSTVETTLEEDLHNFVGAMDWRDVVASEIDVEL